MTGKRSGGDVSTVVAIVLAGGAGTRLQSYTHIPKIFLPIGLEPVLNRPVRACLELLSPENVYVLTRETHPDLQGVGKQLQDWLEDWKKLYDLVPAENVLFEEQLQEREGDGPTVGAIVGLAKGVSSLCERTNRPYALVVAGDNYIAARTVERFLSTAFKILAEHPGAVALGSRQPSPGTVIDQFGVLEAENDRRIHTYVEKPKSAIASGAAEIALGMYLFPLQTLNSLLGEYLSSLRDVEKAGAPGHFIEWLQRKGTTPVYAVALNDEIWIDVGTPSSASEAMVREAHLLASRPQNTRELDVLARTDQLSDKSYFLCRRIRLDPVRRKLGLYFHWSDPIATLDDIQNLQKGTRDPQLWKALSSDRDALAPADDWTRAPPLLAAPVLISGGVFLIDRPGREYSFAQARVPFLIRDPGAPVDNGRLTMPAGRMDKLDLMGVCISELAEELIFISDVGTILLPTPQRYQESARAALLSQVRRKHLALPGVDTTALLTLEGVGRKSGLIEFVDAQEVPANDGYDVEVYYSDVDAERPWTRRYVWQKLFVVADEAAATLEVRATWSAVLSGVAGSDGPSAETMNFGRLRAIVDGDNYGRSVVMVALPDLNRYMEGVREKSAEEALFRSGVSNAPQVPIVALTDGASGRWRFPTSPLRWPVVPLTTAVARIVSALARAR